MRLYKGYISPLQDTVDGLGFRVEGVWFRI